MSAPTPEVKVPASGVRVFGRKRIQFRGPVAIGTYVAGTAVLVALWDVGKYFMGTLAVRDLLSVLSIVGFAGCIGVWTLWVAARARRERVTLDFGRRELIAEWVVHDRPPHGGTGAPGRRAYAAYSFADLGAFEFRTGRSDPRVPDVWIIRTPTCNLHVHDGLDQQGEFIALLDGVCKANPNPPAGITAEDNANSAVTLMLVMLVAIVVLGALYAVLI